MSESGMVPSAASCHNDATCYPDWATEGDAVGRLKFQVDGATAYCTGTMIDSLSQDHIPYFLTANHCIPDEITVSEIKVYWFYETPTCNGIPPIMDNLPKSLDAIYLDGKTKEEFSDFTLLELLGTVPRNLTWAGTTTAEPGIGDSVVGIHHPSNTDDYRRISFGNITSTCNNINYWDIDWYSGTTEEGSSGSCIWNSDHKCIGQLYGQICTFVEPCDPTKISNYGKFSVSYPFIQSYLQGGTDDSLEENDSRTTAKIVSAGAYKGNVVKLNDEDWYKITVPQNTPISVSLSFIHSNGNIDMELYRGSDTTPVSSSKGTGDIEHVEHFNTSAPTDYFVRIFLADDTRNSYNMNVHLDFTSLWAKTFGGTSSEWFSSAQQTSDWGYIVAGGTYSYGAGYNDLWILKLDSSANTQWQKTYGGTSADYANSIHQTSDGGYIVSGATGSSGAGSYDAWVLKLDANGNVQWQKTYGGSNLDFAESIQQTVDGGYIVVGETYSFGAGSFDIWLLKLDANGNIQWQKTYGTSGGEQAYSIQQTSDTGFIVVGYKKVGSYFDVWILKLDASGNVQWQKTYGGNSDDISSFIQQTSDGGFVIAGYTGSFGAGLYDAWVLKLDEGGNIQWQKTYGGTSTDYANSIHQTSDGGYIVAGETELSTGFYDGWALKLDPGGNIQWQKTYGVSNNDHIYSIEQTTDGGFVAAGITGTDALILKFDNNGNINTCSIIGPLNMAATTTNATVASTTASVTNTSIVPAISNATVTTPTATVNAVCVSTPPSPEIFAYPSSLNFGYVNPTKFTIRKVRVRNTGNVDLIINPITITGANAGDFSQTNNCTTLPANSLCAIDVKFSPSSTGTKSAMLNIPSNDPGTPTLNMPLSGVGGTILVVTKGGSGSGTVTSSPAGINCGNDCIEAYSAGTVVTLTAIADTGSTFASWSGDCSGTGTCTVTMGSDKTVTATFNYAPVADLIITTVTGPTTANPGASITVGDTTKNQGTGTSGGSVTKYYWSTNSTWDAGDTYLGERTVPELAAGDSSVGPNIVVTVPLSACSGTFYVIAKADANNQVSETNEMNNNKYKSIKTGPDLIVSAITAPLISGDGKTITVGDTTKNQGGCSAGASTTRYYLSANSTWDALDTPLGERALGSLAPNAEDTGSTTVTIPAGTATGTWYIIARADATGVVTETSETNNNKSKSIKIGPDLIVSAITAPLSATNGSTVTIGDTTKNSGGGVAGASTTKLYLSTNTTYETGDLLLRTRSVSELDAGKTNTQSGNVTLPVVSPGTWYIIAVSDADGVVVETSETNNNKYKAITINP
ncbi:MAG: choice-of-anchor D domain-containing protein [Nitrospirae bacterium]|nr:choice-of-anchor D domain-containing protein [Nitrospirota bacterium]